MVAKDDGEHRTRKFRDAAALLSVVGPAVLVAGLIGTWHLIQYRMGQMESSIRRFESILEEVRFEQVRKSGRFDSIEEKLKLCCFRRNRQLEADQ